MRYAVGSLLSAIPISIVSSTAFHISLQVGMRPDTTVINGRKFCHRTPFLNSKKRVSLIGKQDKNSCTRSLNRVEAGTQWNFLLNSGGANPESNRYYAMPGSLHKNNYNDYKKYR